MVLLENDEFLSQLTKMFQKARASGSVLMTIKQYDGKTKPIPRDLTKYKPSTLCQCLIRATSKSRKISTVVIDYDVPKFQAAYSNLLKGNLDGLKKIKKQKNKTKAAQ